MSLYHQQPSMAGPSSYAAASAAYAQRAPPPVSYHQPHAYPAQPPVPPQPIYHMDPSHFRRDLQGRLEHLTDNNRDIIGSILTFVQQYPRWADIVGQCLEAHIRRVAPWTKLPAFYLLDCISKNTFDPYARVFAAFISPLFLESYDQVDPATRRKMEEMLLTWRTGAPGGKELFGVSSQVAIERAIWGGSASSSTTVNQGSAPPPLSTSQVLSELEFTLGHRQRSLQTNPHDHVLKRDVETLHQLRSLVESGLSQSDLAQILAQMRAMAPPPAAVRQQPPVARTQAPPPPPPPPPPMRPQYSQPPVSQMQQPMAFVPPPRIVPAVPTVTAVSTPPPASMTPAQLQGLLSALMKSGAVQQPTPTGVPPPVAGPGPAVSEPPVQDTDQRKAARIYRQQVLARSVKLTTNDIIRHRPAVVDLQYNRLRLQCPQCGVRFSDDAPGKKDLEEHRDMHFKQNRKANQNVGRGHSRSWFIAIDDWIHETAADVKGKGSADGARRLTVKETVAAEAVKRDTELRSMHVVIPPGDEAKTIKCPICKEAIDPEFLEEDEEWVWRNALKKDDKIFHATCHAEAMSSANMLVSRLKTEAGSSRSATPSSSRATPPKVSGSPSAGGLKRKVEGDERADSSPPTKKMALNA